MRSENEQNNVSKDINSVPVVASVEKKKKLEEEFLKSDKYLKKMTAQD